MDSNGCLEVGYCCAVKYIKVNYYLYVIYSLLCPSAKAAEPSWRHERNFAQGLSPRFLVSLEMTIKES